MAMNSGHSFTFALLLIVSACLPGVAFVPQLLGYTIVLTALALVLVMVVATSGGRVSVRVHPMIVFPLLILWGFFLIALVRQPGAAALKRAPVFIGVSAVVICVLPGAIDRRAFEQALAWTGGVATLLAIPAVIAGPVPVGEQSMLAIEQTTFGELHVATSLFDNPNQLAILTLFGTLGGVSAAAHTRHPRRRLRLLALAGLCVVGLALTDGRAAWLALACVVALAVAFRLGGRRLLAIGVAGVAGAATVTLIVVLTDQSTAAAVGIDERWYIWTAALDAITTHPFLGWGFVNPHDVLGSAIPDGVAKSLHNSYLRMFFITGVPGGLTYLALTIGVGWLALQQTETTGPGPGLFVVAVGVVQVFEGGTVFGVSLFSVIGALWYGYAQPQAAERTVRIPMRVQRRLRTIRETLNV